MKKSENPETAGGAPPPDIDLRDPDDPADRSRRDKVRRSLDERLARPAPTVWLSGQEAAEYLGVSWPTMRQLLIDHRIPHIRLGTLWRIDVAILDHHLHRIATSEVSSR